jgi:Carbohydrate binding module (family 6)
MIRFTCRKYVQNLGLGSLIWLMLTCFSGEAQIPKKYAGKPFVDSVYSQGPQILPGKLEPEYFDFGGEGIAYHDTNSNNSGSGGLNKGGDYLSQFRKNEAVDISFTKFHNAADNSKFNVVHPKDKELYVGWTEPGEWIKYTVDVKTTGTYQVGIMYTANENGQISLSSNDKDISGLLNIKSTFDAADSVKWRQWHHWNYIETLGEVRLKKGLQVITLHTVRKGQMNYDYLEFKLKKRE